MSRRRPTSDRPASSRDAKSRVPSKVRGAARPHSGFGTGQARLPCQPHRQRPSGFASGAARRRQAGVRRGRRSADRREQRGGRQGPQLRSRRERRNAQGHGWDQPGPTAPRAAILPPPTCDNSRTGYGLRPRSQRVGVSTPCATASTKVAFCGRRGSGSEPIVGRRGVDALTIAAVEEDLHARMSGRLWVQRRIACSSLQRWPSQRSMKRARVRTSPVRARSAWSDRPSSDG